MKRAYLQGMEPKSISCDVRSALYYLTTRSVSSWAGVLVTPREYLGLRVPSQVSSGNPLEWQCSPLVSVWYVAPSQAPLTFDMISVRQSSRRILTQTAGTMSNPRVKAGTSGGHDPEARRSTNRD